MTISLKTSLPSIRPNALPNIRPERILRRAPLVCAALLLAACSTSPTGRSQLAFMPAEQLSRLGEQSFADLKRKTPIERSGPINRYVRCVADAVTGEVDADTLWEVVVFEDDSANAFALPGGKIGVHTGMLDIAGSPDQLAAVIGHEIGHVLADHANERLSQGTVTQGALALASAALGAKGVAARGDIVKALGIGAQYGVLLPYSRSHESEADAIGLELMARAGFDPRESIRLWQNMKTSGGATPPELLSSHPAPDTRIRELEARMGEALELYRQALNTRGRPRCQ